MIYILVKICLKTYDLCYCRRAIPRRDGGGGRGGGGNAALHRQAQQGPYGQSELGGQFLPSELKHLFSTIYIHGIQIFYDSLTKN